MKKIDLATALERFNEAQQSFVRSLVLSRGARFECVRLLFFFLYGLTLIVLLFIGKLLLF